ncbi:MAG: site-2 protease family protein [Anaerolineales bacterium]|nr:site-2 protease family protein [Anaerolineales bacterium]
MQLSPTPELDLAERLLPAVRLVMRVTDYTSGGRGLTYAARFRGQLVLESQEAYDRLAPVFIAQGMTLFFRNEAGEHVARAVPRAPRRGPGSPRTNLLLFVLTILSVLLAGELYDYSGPLTLRGLIVNLPRGLPFAVSLLAILTAHEFGHYLVAKYHKTEVTLPFFIPFPGSAFGTMGAFIQMKEPPRNRRTMADIALAGPLAGLLIAIPVLLLGLALSPVQGLPLVPPPGTVLEGNSLLYLLAKWVVKGELLPAPASYAGVAPLVYWIRYMLTGLPAPLGGRDVILSPVAWAGWAGLLVTALNLIPAGQLDGGHLMYVLLGSRVRRLWPFLVSALALMGFLWQGWWIWAGLLFVLGRVHAEPLDEITPLDPRRKVIAVLGLLLFVLVFMPVPLRSF